MKNGVPDWLDQRCLSGSSSDEDRGLSVLEILRVLRLADPGLDTTCLLSFDPGAIIPALAWQEWAETVFSGKLMPYLVRIVEAGRREHAFDILALDRELDGVYDEASVVRSRILGWRLLVDYKPPAGARALVKLRHWALADGLSPHYVVVFGVRCGLFNIPAPQAAGAYLFKEWHCGHLGRLPLGCLPPTTGTWFYEVPGHLQIVAD